MDAFVVEPYQATEFDRKGKMLYLYCIDLNYTFQLTVPSLPFLHLNCLFGHVSFPGALEERRMVVFPHSKRIVNKLKEVDSPCVIEVIASIDFQIHEDEIEDDDKVMLIWDFEMDALSSLTSSQCRVRPCLPDSKSADQFIDTVMPLLDVDRVNCNCSNFDKKGKVLSESPKHNSMPRNSSLTDNRIVPPVSDFQKLNIEEEEEEEEEENDDVTGCILDFDPGVGPSENINNEELIGPCSLELNNQDHTKEVQLYTETFTLKGCSYHEHFQKALAEIKQMLMKGKENIVQIKLHFEPVNRRDENAIVVHACLGNCCKPIGYIPGVKVAKVTHAVSNEEIVKMNIDSVKYQYIWALNAMKYFASVTITKKGRWMKNKDGYTSIMKQSRCRTRRIHCI